jgi:hypothetical protein
VEAHLLDRVGNVGPGEGEGIGEPQPGCSRQSGHGRGPHVGGDLGLSVDRRGAGLTVAHASTLKDVQSILALVEEEVVGPLLY